MKDAESVYQFFLQYIDTKNHLALNEAKAFIRNVSQSGFYESVIFIENTPRPTRTELVIFATHNGERSPYTIGFETEAIKASCEMGKVVSPSPIILFEQAPRQPGTTPRESATAFTESLRESTDDTQVKELFYWEIPQYR